MTFYCVTNNLLELEGNAKDPTRQYIIRIKIIEIEFLETKMKFYNSMFLTQ